MTPHPDIHTLVNTLSYTVFFISLSNFPFSPVRRFLLLFMFTLFRCTAWFVSIADFYNNVFNISLTSSIPFVLSIIKIPRYLPFTPLSGARHHSTPCAQSPIILILLSNKLSKKSRVLLVRLLAFTIMKYLLGKHAFTPRSLLLYDKTHGPKLWIALRTNDV